MSTKTYPTLITSPFGSALWAHLVEADKKFSELGDFKVNLKIDEKEATALIEQIQAEKEKALITFQEEAKAEGKTPKAVAKIKLSDIDPYEEDDEEEGVFVFKFKRKAAYVKDSGEIVHFDVPLIDATGKTIPDDKKPNIGNGSTLRVMAELVPYNMATSGVGVSLRLKKVQIKNLVEYSSDGPGFDAVEDGGYVPAGMDENFGSAGDDSGYSV